MQRKRALVVDVFTRDPLAGTPVGLVPEAEGLTPPQMAAVAAELGGVVTGFVRPSASGGVGLRAFTAEGEVDASARAVIAHLGFLAAAGEADGAPSSVGTAAGDLETDLEGTRAWVEAPASEVRRTDSGADLVAEHLGVDERALDVDGLPIGRASAGWPVVVVPLRFLEDLGGLSPRATAIEPLLEEEGAEALLAFTFDTLRGDSTAHARAFVPTREPTEAMVSGLDAGALAAYCLHVGAFDGVPDEVVIEAGDYLDRPGRIGVRLGDRLRVGGDSAVALDGTLAVPPIEADDIIET